MGFKQFIAAAICVCAGTACFHSQVRGDFILDEEFGQQYSTSTLATFGTHGAIMAGMSVEVTYADATTETQIWTTTGTETGGAFGSSWQITQGPGSTWSNSFNFTTTSSTAIVAINLHGAPGNTVFDRQFGGAGTSTSANGKDIFESLTNISASQDVLATYYDAVGLLDADPVGDLFAGLRIEFETGLVFGDAFAFITDTDTGQTNLQTPEPSSFAL
ncbi:MAG: hypothetical protein AAF483_26380, partial [Planctomycetota bacterium]